MYEADRLTEPLFRRVTRLNDLHDTRTQRLDCWSMVGEHTHITSCRRKVHLHDIGGSEDGLGNEVCRLGGTG